jgi:hypothetical protein
MMKIEMGGKKKTTILDFLELHKNDWCSPLLFVNVMQLHHQGVILLLILEHFAICDVFCMFVLGFSFCVNLIVCFLCCLNISVERTTKLECWKNYSRIKAWDLCYIVFVHCLRTLCQCLFLHCLCVIRFDVSSVKSPFLWVVWRLYM